MPSPSRPRSRPASAWWRVLVLLVLVAATARTAVAVEVEGLTEFSSLVASRSDDDRARLARRGLAEVIVRLAGSSSVLSEPAVMNALDRAESYLVRSRYESTEFTLEGDDGQERPADRLILSFSQAGIDRLLTDAGLPHWGKDRPEVLAWVVMNEGAEEQWVTGTDHQLGAWLDAQAKRRGLPLRFPLQDLTDQMALSAGAVRQMEVASIESASRRYGVDHVIAGIVTPTAAGFRGRWLVLIRGEAVKLDEQAASLDTLTANVLGAAADRMAARYAVRPSDGSLTRVRLSIENLQTLGDYARLDAALAKMAPVKKSMLSEVRGGTVVYQLEIEGSTRQLIDLLALNRNLHAGLDPEQDSASVWRLHYRYTP